MKVKEVLKLVKNDGWYLVRQKGSHMQFKHATKKGLVTIACHRMSDEIARGTLTSIFRQAQIDKINLK